MRRTIVPFIVAGVTLLAAWLAYDQMVRHAPPPAVTSGASPSAASALQGMQIAGIRTAVARRSAVRHTVSLTGQVAATEGGRADITAPLSGVIVQPMVKVGDFVGEGTPVAVINSAYGQTSLQLMQKIEQDQAALVGAQSALTQAQNGLGQAHTSLAQTRTALSQARDNLNQARAELNNATTDFHRKQKLFQGGVAAKSDVDDARERYLKAVSAVADDRDVVRYARRAVEIAEGNIPPATANVQLARQSVGLAQSTVQRDKTIYSQAAVSGATLSQKLTPVSLGAGGAYSPAAAAATTMFYIRAPISGVVTAVAMSSNFSVSPGTVIASMLNTGQVYVDGNAFESNLPFIHEGDAVRVTAAAFPDLKFAGRVRYVGRQVDATTRTVTVRSLITNVRGVLRPAMFVTVALASATRQAALVVPDHAVLVHGDKRFVYVEKAPGKYEKHEVQVGVIADGEAEIRSGLQAGERVVTDGNLVLESQE